MSFLDQPPHSSDLLTLYSHQAVSVEQKGAHNTLVRRRSRRTRDDVSHGANALDVPTATV